MVRSRFVLRSGRTATRPAPFEACPDNSDPFACAYGELKGDTPGAAQKLRLALNMQGVDCAGWPGGPISATRGETAIDATTVRLRPRRRPSQYSTLDRGVGL